MSKRYPGGLVYSTQPAVGTLFQPPIVTAVSMMQTPTSSIPPIGSFLIEYFIVSGGGGGGGNTGSGGGGGGVLNGGLYVSVGTVATTTVGAGGNGGPAAAYSYPSGGQIGQLGTSSSIVLSGMQLAPIGGGGGVGFDMGDQISFKNGGSGGGCATSTIRGFGTIGQGNYGGLRDSASQCSAGGGGAGAVGGAATGSGATSVSGVGGAGIQWPANSGTYYAGGGGGGGGTSNRASNGTGINGGAGGTGGGGAGGNGTAGNPGAQNAGTAGTANTGGGAGGGNFTAGSWGGAGGKGGSGVVIIRYSDARAAASATTGSPTITVAGGYRVYKFTGSGTITF